jgi:glycosyltransferase involved in cell wall biosynthesis
VSTITVGFDDQIFIAQPRGGISKYFVELVTRLPDYGIEPVILSTGTRNVHLAESGLVPELPPLSPALARLDWASWRLIGRPRTTPKPVPSIDVMHHTFTHGSYLNSWAGPRVTTVFDMTPELYPSYFKFGNPHFAKKKFCEVSDAVISISENTAKDIERLYGEAVFAKTTVVPFGVGEQFFDGSGHKLTLPDRYLLFVGVRGGYKDFTTALDAWAEIARTDLSLDLVVAGGGPFSQPEEEQLRATNLRDRVHRVSPTDATMPELYGRADVFVFPSIYEGFGLPTLESLSAGTPAVLADASCSREVGGDAALYFEPGNVGHLVAKLTEAMSPDLQKAVSTLGPQQGRKFSWDSVAAMTADLYRLVNKEE